MGTADASVLERIREGMTVRDRHGDEVGTVKAVYFGAAADTATAGGQPASISEPAVSTHPLIDALARALGRSELPDELRERALYQGFVHIDIRLAPDRIALAEQVARAGPDGVHLGVGRDELLPD
jgi:hypothetical protein